MLILIFKEIKELTTTTSLSHQGIWSPPEKKLETELKKLPIFASTLDLDIAIAQFALLSKETAHTVRCIPRYGPTDEEIAC